ncbi:ubiquinol-cytochrome c reductase cytochrome b subunit [Streptomyces smyrnaeus]|uniref:Cytochrome bc1 complex cytochrome b subunit n=1 Tax=Streptomyces smyrnaeus TaxID=1387713 RepID=A0ABS3XZ82_9ACTN|nr:ubiquinol-cytochrome c reductase cytochrome b subunit [Streptomyces smyrnaeus]MBO8200713.1 ubiquinol-cytochrome c reductase cytochrome b subunit [Streptomyces smyrnaeus]
MPLMAAGKEFLRKAFPDHWSFLLGEIALYSFVVLVLTGTYLTFFFHPDMAEQPYGGAYRPLRGIPTSEAYASVLRICFEIRGGQLIRQIHHWGALLFISAIGVHMLRIFFTGAFRRPRETNWFIGVSLFGLALLEGFCGYSLPDDLLSGTGLRTFQGIMLSIPVVGTYLSLFLFGGEYPGHEIVPRLFSAHILFIPGLLIALITLHLFFVVHLKHTQWPGKGKDNRNVVGKPMVPQYAAKSIGLFLTVFGVLALLGGLLQINPIWAYGPYRTDQASIDSQPDWYVGFIEGALRLMPQAETRFAGHTVAWDVFIPGVVIPSALFLVLYAYPFLERWVTGNWKEHHLCDRPRNHPTRTGLGVAGISAYAVLLAAGGQDVLAFLFDWPLESLTWIFRGALFLLPVLAFWLTKRLCLGLQAQDAVRVEQGDGAGYVRRVADGYQELRRPLPDEKKHRLLVRDTPPPLSTEEIKEAGNLRRTLYFWYFGERIEPDRTPKQKRVVRKATTPPAGPEEEESGK